MKHDEIKIGGIYVAKVTNKLTEVRITGVSQYGGWDAVNTATNKAIRIKTATRLRREVGSAKHAAKASERFEKVMGSEADDGLKVDPPQPKPPVAHQKAHVARSATKKAKATTEPKKVRNSGLNAAALVLAEANKPMKVSDVMAEIAKRKLWSTGGKTPEATVYAAIIREIKAKGAEARFWKVDRGTFGITDAGKDWARQVWEKQVA